MYIGWKTREAALVGHNTVRNSHLSPTAAHRVRCQTTIRALELDQHRLTPLKAPDTEGEPAVQRRTFLSETSTASLGALG